jgi:hypothetical protein
MTDWLKHAVQLKKMVDEEDAQTKAKGNDRNR